MKTNGTRAVIVGALVLSGCVGGSDGSDRAAPADAEVEVSVVTEVPTTTIEVADEPERDQTVKEFLAAAELNADCTTDECITAQATYSRYQNLYELAGEIPGDEVAPYVVVMSSAWEGFNVCLSNAESRFEKFDCVEESDMERAIIDLYNILS